MPRRSPDRCVRRLLAAVFITLGTACLPSGLLARALAQSPPTENVSDLEATLAAGDALFDSGKFTEAIEQYQKADRQHPSQARVKISIAATCAELRRRAEGIAALDAAIALDPARLSGEEAVTQLRDRLEALPAESLNDSAEVALAIRTTSKILARAKGKSVAEAKEIARVASQALAPALWDPDQSNVEAWQLAGITAVLLDDKDLGAFAFEAIGRLRPEYHTDLGLLDLMAELKAMGIESKASTLCRDRAQWSNRYATWMIGAKNGKAEALYNLGVMYSRGEGVPRDVERGDQFFQRAADMGDAQALHNIGVKYAVGRGVPKDEALAFSYFQRAAEKGEPRAMTQLGAHYVLGKCVARDVAKGAEWFSKAAHSGDAVAMCLWGDFLALGDFVPQDDAKAVEWYTKAAQAGNAMGMHNLGTMYASGRGVPQDDAKAIEWYTRAARLGLEAAQNELRRRDLTW